MDDLTSAVGSLSVGVIIAAAVLVLVQLTLQIVALVQMARTPSDRISIGGRKWAWALIIIFGELIGVILWFVVGRTPAPAVEQVVATATTDRARSAADALYGAPPAPPSPTPQAPEPPSDAPDEFADDVEVGSDGTGAGELP